MTQPRRLSRAQRRSRGTRVRTSGAHLRYDGASMHADAEMRETASRDDLLSGLLLVAFHLYHLACYGTMTSEDKEQDLQRLRHLLVIPWRLGPGNSRRHRKRLRWLARHVHASECRPY